MTFSLPARAERFPDSSGREPSVQILMRRTTLRGASLGQSPMNPKEV